MMEGESAFPVETKYTNVRFDRMLLELFDAPHSLIVRLLREKKILLNGAKAKIGDRLKPDDAVTVPKFLKYRTENLGTYISDAQISEFMKNVIHDSDDFLIINKPAGLSTQGGIGIKYSVDAYLAAIDPEYRLVHRLDKGTTGCLMVAKNRQSARILTTAFADHEIDKTYLAIVHGVPTRKNDTIRAKIFSNVDGNVCICERTGLSAITHYEFVRALTNTKNEEFSLLNVRIETGRKHQIRVHLNSIGHPIVGDERYGVSHGDMMLHAQKLTYRGTTYEAELPEYFKKFIGD